MDTSSSSGLPQQSPLAGIPGINSTLGNLGGGSVDPSSFSNLPYGGNLFAGDNLFTIFGNGVNPLTVGDPYANGGSSTSTPTASGSTTTASSSNPFAGVSGTPAASDSTSTPTASGGTPVASVSGTTTGTSDSTNTPVASDSTSLLQNSPLAQIPGFDPTTISVDDNPFTALAAVFPNLDLSSYIGGSTATTGGSTSTTVTTSGSNPVPSTSTPAASSSTSTTGTSGSGLPQQSPLAGIPGINSTLGNLGGSSVDPSSFSNLPYGGNLFAGDNLFTIFGNGVNPLTVGDPYASSSPPTASGSSTTVTGSNPFAGASGTPAASDSTSTPAASDSSSLLQQSPLAAIPGFDPSSISVSGNPFTGVSNTPTASGSTSTTPASGSSIPQQSPFDLASTVLGNNSPVTSGSDISSFLLNVFGQGGSPLDTNNQAIIFGGSSNPFASIGNSSTSGDNPFANGANPFAASASNPYAGTADNPYASGTASITPQNAPVGQFNTDVGSNNATIGNGNWGFGSDSATIGNGDWNFGNGNATIGNGNWLLNFSSNNTTLGNGNWYRNSSNSNETLGNGNWYFGSNNATIGNGNWDFGSNNTVIGSGNWLFTSNNTVVGNGILLTNNNSSNVSAFVPGLNTSVDSLINSLVGNFGTYFVDLTGNLDASRLQTFDQVILSKGIGNDNPFLQKHQTVPESGLSAELIVLGLALLLWSSFKKGFPLQKHIFRIGK